MCFIMCFIVEGKGVVKENIIIEVGGYDIMHFLTNLSDGCWSCTTCFLGFLCIRWFWKKDKENDLKR